MSQEKVDKYKAYKKNKAKILKKEKILRRVEYTCIAVVCAAFIGWFGWSIYSSATASTTSTTASTTAAAINFTDFDTYYGGLTLNYS